MADKRRETAAAGGNVERQALAPPPSALLDDPLGLIDADHARQRTVCRVLRQLSLAKRIDSDLGNDIANFLVRELPLHHRDEDEDLFPLLAKRALPEDGLAPILAQLAGDHVGSCASARKIAAALSSQAGKPTAVVDRASAELARHYAESEQRHLAIENAIVMVIARKRLKAADLQAMSRSMKARRGVQY